MENETALGKKEDVKASDEKKEPTITITLDKGDNDNVNLVAYMPVSDVFLRLDIENVYAIDEDNYIELIFSGTPELMDMGRLKSDIVNVYGKIDEEIRIGVGNVKFSSFLNGEFLLDEQINVETDPTIIITKDGQKYEYTVQKEKLNDDTNGVYAVSIDMTNDEIKEIDMDFGKQ